MRIRTVVCSLALVAGLAGGALAATSGEAAPNPCPGRLVATSIYDDPTGMYATYDLNNDEVVCVSKDGTKITDDHLHKKR
jgi:hypothetical protein